MNKITSVQNELIKTITKLHIPKGRKAQQKFLAEGIRVLTNFAHASWKPTELFSTEQMAEKAYDLFHKEPIIISDNVLKKLSTVTTPSGIIAVFSYQKETPLKLSSGLVLVNITDPGNMGTLLRSAVAFGSKAVVIADGCDPYAPKVIQSSAGAVAQIDILQWSWEKLLKNKENFTLCALVVKDGEAPATFKDKKDLLLVVGNEAHGLSQEQIDDCDAQLTLPMNKNSESLNAAIAGSIALYLL